jgi:hypothetical protein
MRVEIEWANILPALISVGLSENLKSQSEKMKDRRRDSGIESRRRAVVRRA